ncbi:MAG: hypothetical protein LBP85_08165 [Prevotellaceae bacterium]|jgi:hypothetical protein|nr:hypothetical protein [Prevotellaceae bacterium]
MLLKKKKHWNMPYALQYTKKTFASYAADEEVIRLCEYIGMFANKQNVSCLKPVKINDQLSSFDLYHFGWNIWNHFRIRACSTCPNRQPIMIPKNLPCCSNSGRRKSGAK